MTHVSHLLSRELIHPVVVMPRRDPGKDTSQSSVYTPLSAELQCDLHLVNLKSMTSDDTALLLHHVVAECSYTIWGATRYTCPLHGNDVVSSFVIACVFINEGNAYLCRTKTFSCRKTP